MTEKTQKLKPCPFCGGKAEIRNLVDAGSAIQVVCRCGATLFGSRHHFSDEDEAASSWNRRAPKCEKE